MFLAEAGQVRRAAARRPLRRHAAPELWPGDASTSTHHLSFDDIAPVTTRRTFLRQPASADECIRDHMTQLQNRLEEQDLSVRFGPDAPSARLTVPETEKTYRSP
jgi:hypothetical protein